MNRLTPEQPDPDDFNAVALVKGGERYVLLYYDHQSAAALRALGRMATNEQLSFNWYDAAVLSKRIQARSKP